MRKDQQENTGIKGNPTHCIHQVHLLGKDWDLKIMSYVMLVVLMVALIAATVAWFFYIKVVAVSNMEFTTASSDSLKVEIKNAENPNATDGFIELEEGEEDSVFVDLDMPVFENVEQYDLVDENSSVENTNGTSKKVNRMAPGVYGSLTIRLTPLNPEINHYRITPAALFTYADGKKDTVSETGKVNAILGKEKLQALAKGHILFFADRREIPSDSGGTITIGTDSKAITEYTHNGKYVFCDSIDADIPMEGELSWNDTEQKGETLTITVYWYWPYEYSNLSSGIQSRIQLPATEFTEDVVRNPERLQYFDKDKMQEMLNSSITWNEIQLYDFADTRIGTDVKSIRMHLKVDGYHAVQTQSEPNE